MKQLVLAGFAFSALILPAYAGDSFNQGQAEYTAGRYAEAKTALQKDIKAKPSWKAHYLLANCYMQLKDAPNAKKSYEACAKLKPPADIKQNCDKALAFMATNSLTAPASAPLATIRAIPRPVKTAASDDKADDAKSNALEDRKQRILDEAERQANKVREDLKEKLEGLKASGNQLFRFPDGHVGTDADPDDVSRVSAEAEDRINKIMTEAKSRADRLR